MRLRNGYKLALVAILGLALQSAEEVECEKITRGDNPIGTVAIVTDSVAAQGRDIQVSIVFRDTTISVGGFNLYIEYDQAALVFDSAGFGALTKSEWEYLNSRSGLLNPQDSASTTAGLRIVAIADTEDKEKKTPKPRSMVGPGELVTLYFYVGERHEFADQATYIRFIWTKCDDNSFSDKDGRKLYLSRDVYDAEGRKLARGMDKYSGANIRCFTTRRNRPSNTERAFDFRSAKMLIGTKGD